MSDAFPTQKDWTFPPIIYVIPLFSLVFLYEFEYFMMELHLPFFDSGACRGVVIKALHYKSPGRGFYSR
jgi:hypothetical protein